MRFSLAPSRFSRRVPADMDRHLRIQFTPHVKHDKLVNQDDEHREVAAGADTLGDLPTTEQGSVGRQADEQRLV